MEKGFQPQTNLGHLHCCIEIASVILELWGRFVECLQAMKKKIQTRIQQSQVKANHDQLKAKYKKKLTKKPKTNQPLKLK
jgi:hypothetical protein